MSTSTRPSSPRQLPSVSGTVRVLRRVGTVNANTGEIAINGKPYFCRCLEHGYQLFSFDARKQATTSYDLPADLSSCEDNKCKHQKALAALVAAGKLPALTCNPVPRVDDLADADDAYLDDSEADAWHSQYDAA